MFAKKNILQSFLIAFLFFAPLFANPFLSPTQSNPETDETTSLDSIDTIIDTNEFDNGEVDSTHIEVKRAPQVRIGQTSEKNLQAQRSLREKLGTSFYEWKELENSTNPDDKKQARTIFFTILLVAFVFGFFHALGPGHRKTIVFSFYISRKAPWWEPLLVSLSLAGLHAGSAIVIMLILSNVSGAISGRADTIAKWMEGVSYCILIVTALVLLTHTIAEQIIYTRKRKSHEETIIERKKISLTAFIFSGIYPCPGAVLVLVLAFTLQMIQLGILSVISMSIGMAFPILISAYIAWTGREGLFYFFKQKETSISKLTFVIEVVGYVFLLAFSLYIAWPFIMGLPK